MYAKYANGKAGLEPGGEWIFFTEGREENEEGIWNREMITR